MEDRRTNRLVESMNIFETIVNNKLFLNVSIILFLNKTDLLVDKIRTVNICKNFPEFRGDPHRLEDVQVCVHNDVHLLYNTHTHTLVLTHILKGVLAPNIFPWKSPTVEADLASDTQTKMWKTQGAEHRSALPVVAVPSLTVIVRVWSEMVIKAPQWHSRQL